jgi:hypothetical protein
MKSFARLVAALLALAVAGCQFLPWANSTPGTDVPWRSLITPGTVGTTGWVSSMALPVTIAAGVALFGAISGARALVVIGGLLSVAVPTAWILVNALDGKNGVPLSVIGFGAYGAALAGFLLLVLAAVASDSRVQNLR